MFDEVAKPLSGGAQTRVVRIGSTVRRPAHDRSVLVQAFLEHLAAAGFAGAPRPRGFDDQGREVVGYIDGQVPHTLPFRLSDGQPMTSTLLIRGFHDASVGFPHLDGHEVMCHGDLGPHNIVFRGDHAVGIIDWDGDVRPGRRANDFAHAVWCCADLTDVAVSVAEQARRTRLMCSLYPAMTPEIVVTELRARFQRAKQQHAAAGRRRAVTVFDGLLGWLDRHGAELVEST